MDGAQRQAVASVAAGFVGLLSLFNIAGCFFWTSFSDRIGRKLTYAAFFAFGIAPYSLSPWAAHQGNQALFVAMMCVILSMYGGGFATVPAYLADMFGPIFVAAIHGRLLTAWSTAGIIGPLLIAGVREAQLAAGMPSELVYGRTPYMLAGLLVIGFIANLLVRPVSARWHVQHAQRPIPHGAEQTGSEIGHGGFTMRAMAAWACIGLPLPWGFYMTLRKVVVLFAWLGTRLKHEYAAQCPFEKYVVPLHMAENDGHQPLQVKTLVHSQTGTYALIMVQLVILRAGDPKRCGSGPRSTQHQVSMGVPCRNAHSA